MLGSVQSGTVALTLVLDERVEFASSEETTEELDTDEEECTEKVGNAPRRSASMYDCATSITLGIAVPDCRRMAYATFEDLMSDAREFPEVVCYNLPVAIATILNTQVEGAQLATRERTTASTFDPPHPFPARKV